MVLLYFDCTKCIKVIHTHGSRTCNCVNTLIQFRNRLYPELFSTSFYSILQRFRQDSVKMQNILWNIELIFIPGDLLFFVTLSFGKHIKQFQNLAVNKKFNWLLDFLYFVIYIYYPYFYYFNRWDFVNFSFITIQGF